MEEKELALIPRQDETRVYANESGTITIEQLCLPDSLVFVTIAPEFVDKLTNALNRARLEIAADEP